MEGPIIFNSRVFKTILFTSIIILFAQIALSFSSLAGIAWTTIEKNQQTFTHSLMSCTDCPNDYQSTTYKCLQKTQCQAQSSRCEQFKNLERSRWVAIYSQALAVGLSALITVRLIYISFNRDYGHPLGLLILIAIKITCKISGTLTYFILSQVSFSSDCDPQQEACIQSGVIILITTTTLSAFNTSILLFIYKNRPKVLQNGIKIIDLDGQTQISALLTKVLVIAILGLVFISLSLVWNWVSFQTSISHYGKILTFNQQDDLEYSCVSFQACLNQTGPITETRLCQSMNELWKAGKSFFWTSLVGFLFGALWVQNIIYSLMNRMYGTWGFNIVIAWSTIVVQITGLTVWSIKSGASISGGCQAQSTDTQLAFCTQQGYLFAIIGNICFFLGGFFYTAINYYRSRRSEIMDPHPSLQNSPSKIVLDNSPEILNETHLYSQTPDLKRKYYSSTKDSSSKSFRVVPIVKEPEEQESTYLCKSCFQGQKLCRITNQEIYAADLCGHLIHRECGERVDGARPCTDCPPKKVRKFAKTLR